MRILFLALWMTSCSALGLVEAAASAQQDAWSWQVHEQTMKSQQVAPKISLAQLLPSFGISAAQQSRVSSYDAGVFNEFSSSTSLQGQASISIFNPTGWASYKSAEAKAASSLDDYYLYTQSFILDLVNRYFTVLKADKSFLLADKNVAMNKKLMADTEQKYQVGLLTLADLSEAQAAFDQALATKIQAQVNVALAQRQLVLLLQFEPPMLRDIDLYNELVFEPLMHSVANNYAVEKYQHLVKAAEYTVEQAKAGLYPNVTANITYQLSPVLISGTSVEGRTTAAGLSLQWTPFDGGATLAQLELQQYMKQATYAQLRQTMLEAKINEATLRQQLETARYQLGAQRQALLSAQVYLDAVTASFDAGQRTITDVLDAQRALTQQEQSLYSMLYETMTLYLQLAQILSYPTTECLTMLDSFLNQEWAWMPLSQ